MRHRKNKKILDRDRAHRNALLLNLAISFFQHGHVKTTLAKAKTVKPLIEQLIHRSKTNTEASRRLVTQRLKNRDIANKIVRDLAHHYKDRKGGYTRLIRLGQTRSDGSSLALLELMPYAEPKTKENK